MIPKDSELKEALEILKKDDIGEPEHARATILAISVLETFLNTPEGDREIIKKMLDK